MSDLRHDSKRYSDLTRTLGPSNRIERWRASVSRRLRDLRCVDVFPGIGCAKSASWAKESALDDILWLGVGNRDYGPMGAEANRVELLPR